MPIQTIILISKSGLALAPMFVARKHPYWKVLRVNAASFAPSRRFQRMKAIRAKPRMSRGQATGGPMASPAE